jgi:hypothetical protein
MDRARCALMTKQDLAGFYRRYNACCNEHRFDDFHEFAVDRIDAGRIAEVWGMAFHLPLLEQVR